MTVKTCQRFSKWYLLFDTGGTRQGFRAFNLPPIALMASQSRSLAHLSRSVSDSVHSQSRCDCRLGPWRAAARRDMGKKCCCGFSDASIHPQSRPQASRPLLLIFATCPLPLPQNTNNCSQQRSSKNPPRARPRWPPPKDSTLDPRRWRRTKVIEI